MKNSRTIPRLLAPAVFCLFSYIAPAQNEPALLKYYLDAGLGITNRHGVMANLGVNGVFKNNWTGSVSFHFAAPRDKNMPSDFKPGLDVIAAVLTGAATKDYPENKLNIFSLTGGKLIPFNEKLWITLEGGPAFFSGEKFTYSKVDDWLTGANYSWTTSKTNQVGATLKADFVFAVSNWFGLGVGAFSNLNSIQSIIGGELKLYFGKLREKK